MQKLNTLLSIFFLCLASIPNLQGQSCTNDRYIAPNFSVTRIDNLNFATAEAVVYPPYVSELTTYNQNLDLDIYIPDGDQLNKRPLVVMAFGGAFLVGWKRQPQLVDFCEALAARGFVVASIDYRLGFNALSEDTAVRAVYRGAQDVKAAVRYLKANAANFGIDPNLVFAGGNSAGGISALHAAFVSDAERASSPLLAPTYSGGVFNNWSDLGCTDCSGNSYEEDGTPIGVINLWGALGDLNFIPGKEVPVVSFYGTSDIIVDPGAGAPFGTDAIFPTLYGSIPIHEQLDAFGFQNAIYGFEGEGHEPWLNSGIATVIQEKSAEFLVEVMKPEALPVSGAATTTEHCTETYTVPNIATSTYCWDVVGGTIVSTDIDGNTIDIEWGAQGTGTVMVREINCNLVEGDWIAYDVSIEACRTTTSSAATIISGNVIRLDWDAANCADKYKVRYRINGSGNGWTEVNATINQRFLNELQPNTLYEYAIKTNCTLTNSAWTTTATFTTSSDVCDRPEIVTADNISATSATLNWPTDPDDVKYKVRYKIAGSAWTEVFSNVNSLSIPNLNSGTTYKYKAKTKCPLGWTNWGAKYSFTTLASFTTNQARMTNNGMHLFPNPTSDILNIDLGSTKIKSIHLLDVFGKTIKNIIIDNDNILRLDVSTLEAGIYIINAKTNQQELLTQKFVINR